MAKFIDLTGRTINNWKIIGRWSPELKQGYWDCQCLGCGKRKAVGGAGIRSGRSSQCRDCKEVAQWNMNPNH